MPKLTEYRGRLAEIPFDFYELVGALAPRVLFVNAPLHDSDFRPANVDQIVEAAKAVYRLYGAEQNVQVEHPDCGHDFPDEPRARAFRLLEKNLTK